MKKRLIVATLSITVAAVIKRVARKKCCHCTGVFNSKDLLILENNEAICDLCASHMNDLSSF